MAVAILLVIVGSITGNSLWRFLATSPGPETVVQNQSNVPYVAEIDDNHAPAQAFVYLPANALTVIDSIGEVNSATNHVWLWDAGCANRQELAGHYSQGGTITIAADGSASFIPERNDRIGPTERDTGRPSCREAVGALASRW